MGKSQRIGHIIRRHETNRTPPTVRSHSIPPATPSERGTEGFYCLCSPPWAPSPSTRHVLNRANVGGGEATGNSETSVAQVRRLQRQRHPIKGMSFTICRLP